MFWAYTGLLTRYPRKCSGMVPKRARNNSRICLSDSQQGSWSLTKNVTKKGPEMGVTREPKWFPNRSQNGFKSEVGNPVRRQEGSQGGPRAPELILGAFWHHLRSSASAFWIVFMRFPMQPTDNASAANGSAQHSTQKEFCKRGSNIIYFHSAQLSQPCGETSQ